MKSPADRRARATRITMFVFAAIALLFGYAAHSWWTAMLVYYATMVSMLIGQRIQRIGR
jgi:uncharacterized membrane protein YfcA